MQKFVWTIALIASATMQLPLLATASLSQPIAQTDRQLAQVNSALARSLNNEQQQLLRRAIEAAQTISAPAAKARTFAEIAVLYLIDGQFDLAADFLAQASAISSTLSDPQIRAQSLLDIASVESQLPQPPNPIARIEELQALIAQIPATIDRDSLFWGLAQLQASQGQFDRFSQTLTQVQNPDVVEYVEYGALANYGFWAFQPEHFEQAIVQIEQAERFPPLSQQAIEGLPPSANLSASDLLAANRIKMLVYLFGRASFFQQDDTSIEQITNQRRILLAKIQQQIARLQAPVKLEYQARLVMSLTSSDEFQTEAAAQYDQLLITIETSSSPPLQRAALLSEVIVRLADPASPAAQSGVQLTETLLAQVDDSQATGKVMLLHRLAGLLFEVQPERAIDFTDQASQLIAQIPQASDRTAAWIESAQLYQQLGRDAAAIAALEQVTPLLAEVENPFDLALRWIALGRADRVEQIFEQTQNNSFLGVLAGFYIEQGELEQAIALKDRATQPFTQVEILHQVSQAYIEANQLDQAAALAQEAIALLQTIPPTDEIPQITLNLAFLSVSQTYLRTSVPLDSIFQIVDSIDQAEMQVAFYQQWVMQDEVPTTQTGIWQRFERSIVAIQDPELRDQGWSSFALSARQLQQPDRFEQAIAAIQDSQVKAHTLLTSVVIRQNNPDQITP